MCDPEERDSVEAIAERLMSAAIYKPGMSPMLRDVEVVIWRGFAEAVAAELVTLRQEVGR